MISIITQDALSRGLKEPSNEPQMSDEELRKLLKDLNNQLGNGD